jgi:hypothetical protein
MRDTIDMAREAKFPMAWISDNDGGVIRWKDIKVFEALVRADQDEKYKWDVHSCGPTCKRYGCVAMREAVEAEREACATVCEKMRSETPIGKTSRIEALFFAARAIRNRGNT